MCQFACKNPSACRRFTVSPVKEDDEARFVRNRNVQFFSPASDSESDDDDDQPSHWPSHRLTTTGPPHSTTGHDSSPHSSHPASIACSSSAVDSAVAGFVDDNEARTSQMPNDDDDDGKAAEEASICSAASSSSSGKDSGIGSEHATQISLKSILKTTTTSNNGEGMEDKQKRRVRFGDELGHPLVHCRPIQSRRVAALYADLVQIGPIQEEHSGSGSQWRNALLRKMYAFQSSSSPSRSQQANGSSSGQQRLSPPPTQRRG